MNGARDRTTRSEDRRRELRSDGRRERLGFVHDVGDQYPAFRFRWLAARMRRFRRDLESITRVEYPRRLSLHRKLKRPFDDDAQLNISQKKNHREPNRWASGLLDCSQLQMRFSANGDHAICSCPGPSKRVPNVGGSISPAPVLSGFLAF